MTTFGQLATRVRQQLLGYTTNQESVAELDGGMSASDTTFTCAPDTVTALSRGLVEIDDELILVKSYDQSSGAVTVMGGTNGRGAEGTVAASHSDHSLVTCAPAYPRARIKEVINDTIQALYPDLVVFASTEITFNAAQVEYELPADVSDVWYVTARTTGPSKVSFPAPNWRFNPSAMTSDFATGKSLQLMDPITPGRPVTVVYAKPPSLLTGDTQELTATGYPDRYADLIIYGCAMRLLSGAEAARLQMQAVEASERARLVPVESAAKSVQLFSALYTQRLQEERTRLFSEMPNYATFQGS